MAILHLRAQPRRVSIHSIFSPLISIQITTTINCSEAHLYGNVVLQLLLGIPLEMVHTWRVPLIYFAGALGGSLLQGAVIQDASLIGGSPALYSFYSAHIATVIMVGYIFFFAI